MMNTGTLKLATRGDREIVMTRVFAAPSRSVCDAFTKPELLKRWLLGPPGWSMVVCEVALQVGDRYRYVWRGPEGIEMGLRGVLREISPPERIVATEEFDQPWYPGEAVGTLMLVEEGGKTTLTQTILYDSREARDLVLRSPMERGVAMSYDRMTEVLASLASSAAEEEAKES